MNKLLVLCLLLASVSYAQMSSSASPEKSEPEKSEPGKSEPGKSEPEKTKTVQKTPAQALFDAVEDKDLKKVKQLISQGLSPDAKNENGESIIPAMMRVDGYIPDRVEIVNYLIEQGADINHVSGLDLTLLHICALAEMFSTVELLIDKKIDTKAKNSFGETALFYTKSIKMIKLLISKNAGTMQDVNEDGDTLLHDAVGIDPDLKLVEFLLEYIDINSKNKAGNTVLIEALGSSYYPEKIRKTVDFLLKKGADVNASGQYGRSALLTAFRNRKLGLAAIEKLIKAGADINHQDEDGRQALHYAAANNLVYTKFLLEKNADINAQTREKETPLIVATRYNRKGIVKYMLGYTPDLNITDKQGKTALNYAREGDFSDIAKMLVEKGAKAAPQAEIDRIAALLKKQKEQQRALKKKKITGLKSAIRAHQLEQTIKYYTERTASPDAKKLNMHKLALYVIEKGSVEILKYFIGNGFDVNSKDKDGYSLLHDAVFFNRMDMVEYLLGSGLDVNYISSDDSSVFSMNANSSVKMVDYLISKGVKVDKTKEAGIVSSAVYYRNPVMAEYFIKKGYKFDESILKNEKYLLKLIQKQDVDMMKFLIKKGLDIETKVFIYGDKATLLHLAVMIKANKVVKFLLAAGADANARNTADKPIFPAAINNGDMEVIKALYDNGANLSDTSGHYNQTPLHMALDLQRIEIIRFLVEKGADVNAVDRSDKNSALHMAAQRGYLDALKRMVEKGGNVHLLNKARKAPLDVAIEYEQKAAAAYLTRMEAKK